MIEQYTSLQEAIDIIWAAMLKQSSGFGNAAFDLLSHAKYYLVKQANDVLREGKAEK